MAGKVTLLVDVNEEGQQKEPLNVRIIGVTGNDAEISVVNNLQTPVTINKVIYASTEDGTTVKGVVEKPGIVNYHKEIRFTVSVASALETSLLSVQLTFYAETHGVNFTYEITVYDYED